MSKNEYIPLWHAPVYLLLGIGLHVARFAYAPSLRGSTEGFMFSLGSALIASGMICLFFPELRAWDGRGKPPLTNRARLAAFCTILLSAIFISITWRWWI